MKKKWLAYPYMVWMAVFIVIPMALVLFYAFTVKDGESVRFSLANFQKFCQPVYLKVALRSVMLAFYCTIGCFFLGYPLAMILAGKEYVGKRFLLLLLILPMWMNILLRTYAWMTLLEKNGLINTFLGHFGLGPYQFLYTDIAVVIGMIYNFLPFMVLPIYSVLVKMDHSLIEAAEDLGADRLTVFRKVTFPLSIPGVMSGVVMVFMPAVSTFIISRLLGGGQFSLIGNLIEQQFLWVGDWHFGSALSIVMMILILISTAILNHYDKDHDNEGVGGLW